MPSPELLCQRYPTSPGLPLLEIMEKIRVERNKNKLGFNFQNSAISIPSLSSTMSSAMLAPRPLAITSTNRITPKSNRILTTRTFSRPALQICPRASSADSTEQATTADISKSVAVLKQASIDYSAPPSAVFNALRNLEQAKLPTEDWPAIIGGTASPGRRWRLIFTSGTKDVQKAMKSAGQGSGKYFPLTAVQRWDSTTSQIENGIFLGHVAALIFSGKYQYAAMKGKKLSFDFDTLKLKLGPLTVPIKLKEKITDYSSPPKDPFFLFFYVSDDLIAARGRGGGIAFWARTTPAWELENGVA